MRTTWSFHTAGQLVFGPGAIFQLGELLARRGLRRVLIVTDRVLDEVGIVDQVRQPLREAAIDEEVFNDGEAEPSIDTALRAIQRAADFQPQAILGLGGGSNMDLAKITAAVHTHGGSPRDYFGFDNLPGPVLPLVKMIAAGSAGFVGGMSKGVQSPPNSLR